MSRCQSGSRQQYLAWAGPRPGARTGAGPGVGRQGAVYRYRYTALSEFIDTQRNVYQCYGQCNDRYPSLPRPSVPTLPSLPHTAAVFPSTRQRQQCSRCDLHSIYTVSTQYTLSIQYIYISTYYLYTIYTSPRQRQQCSRCWAPGHGFWALVARCITYSC